MDPCSARESQRRQRWRALQSAAIDLVDQRGFDAVTADDIAAAAGFSRRTFFNHFATKAGALFDPDPEDAERLAQLLDAIDDRADLWASLRAVCLAYVDGREERIAVRRRRLVADYPELGDYHRTAHRHVEDTLARWAATRCPEDPFAPVLAARAATAVVTTAFGAWDVDEGPAGLLALVGAGFDLVAAGFDTPDESA
ncbi:MAG: TetR family transcriptional regulator [Acidimicrobiales bacterium]